MFHRTISLFCIAFLLTTQSLFANGDWVTDSLLYLLNNNLVKDEAHRYDIISGIVSSSVDADTIIKYSELAIQLAGKLKKNPARPTVYKGIGYLNSGRLGLALECFMKAANY